MQQLAGLRALEAVPWVLGARLLYDSPEGRVSGRIVEVEAYTRDDLASHSYKPMTKRTEALFDGLGTIYIYFIYGKHYCLNLVLGDGEALLIRAVEPIEGIALMRARRGINDDRHLCDGPAKVVEAFGIPASLNGERFNEGPLRIELGGQVPMSAVTVGPRVGISKGVEAMWRFRLT